MARATRGPIETSLMGGPKRRQRARADREALDLVRRRGPFPACMIGYGSRCLSPGGTNVYTIDQTPRRPARRHHDG